MEEGVTYVLLNERVIDLLCGVLILLNLGLIWVGYWSARNAYKIRKMEEKIDYLETYFDAIKQEFVDQGGWYGKNF